MNQNIEVIEDYYDFHHTYLKALINSISVDMIKEPFIGVLSKNVQDDGSMQKVFPRHYNNVQKAEIQYRVQKKAEYGRLMGNFKKALNYSMKDDDQKVLNELILSYISEKEKKRKAESQITVI
ncbi:19930_t:CDS:2 [Racocetra fulgida]|uniref:19930_t:CDS:1 n=1 Tax=Racocetra fulgida TaxID=60492 RepID=A0A9N9DMV9_9GLOM|nr:19930_t:CDS:2 [Racocetra fulgida]